MHELRVRKRRASIRVHGVDVRRVRIRRLDVEHEPEPPQQRVLKVARGLALPVLRHAPLDVQHDRGLHREPHGEARLERVAVRDRADLRHVRLDQRQPVPLDRARPHAQHVLDAPRRGAYPVQLEMEYCRGVVDQVMVQDHRFCPVAFLWTRKKDARAKLPGKFNKRLTLLGSISMTILWLKMICLFGFLTLTLGTLDG